MYNFLDPKLLPKVSTDSPVTDQYEASNLISANYLVKSRGFIAYTSIKPPVEVDFELLCPVSISHMILSTTVGSQKTTGIEIFVKNLNSCQFLSIGRAAFSEPGVIFCNPRFYSKHSRPRNTNVNFHMAFLKADMFRVFTRANVIKVRIFRTERSVPCMAGVEIWGRIAKICSEVTVKTVESLMTDKCNSVSSNNISTERKEAEDFQIPEDFQDALTYEMMAMPMTLPSGHTIDQSTLDKCLANDASYGRHGWDPFTGLKFTDTRKPVFNVALKTRIDMFLMQNSSRSETYGLKRTLGRTNASSIAQPSSELYYSTSNQSKRPKLENGKDTALDEAVSKVLSDSKFIFFTRENNKTSNSQPQCVSCSGSHHLYKLPCKHVCCRTCLLEMCEQLKCKFCACVFTRNEPEKLNLCSELLQ